jgi:2-hydroxychromene-2-carboxylate isomerase
MRSAIFYFVGHLCGDRHRVSIAAGVFGAPFFIADDQPFFGNDHLWMLEQWLREGEWKGPAD